MDIGIIGSGKVGRALADVSVRAGHGVTMSAAHIERAEEAAKATGALAAASNFDAIAGADIVILAIPSDALADAVVELGDALAGVTVVDTTNRYDGADPGAATDGGSNTEMIQELARDASVVKALNAMFSSRIADPIVDGEPVDAYFAGDDPEAKAKVARYLSSIGLNPVDAGGINMARVLEGMGHLLIALQARPGGTWRQAWKLVDSA